jgi:hypothetical protein
MLHFILDQEVKQKTRRTEVVREKYSLGHHAERRTRKKARKRKIAPPRIYANYCILQQ